MSSSFCEKSFTFGLAFAGAVFWENPLARLVAPSRVRTDVHSFRRSRRPSTNYRFLPRPRTTASRSRRHRRYASTSAPASDTGKVRANNEDHFLVSRISRKQEILLTNVPEDQFPAHPGEDGYAMIVADGMGGMAAGEVASRLAITTGLKLFHKSPKWGFKINQKEAKELFERVSQHLRDDRHDTHRTGLLRPPTLRHGHHADPRLQRWDRPVHNPPWRLARICTARA